MMSASFNVLKEHPANTNKKPIIAISKKCDRLNFFIVPPKFIVCSEMNTILDKLSLSYSLLKVKVNKII
jgi:hypothetical protein